MIRTSLAIFTIAASLTLTPATRAQDVTLRKVKYDVLREEVVKNRGKVVLVDLWGFWCIPCKKAFPHTVALSQKYPKDLAVISVALDDNPERFEKSLKFLQDKKATFTNLWLDEPQAFWQQKFRTTSLPAMYVFNRKGEWTKIDESELGAPLDALIEELVAEK